MSTKLKVYCNEDDALLFWRISQPITGCRGFAIQRRIKRMGENKAVEDFLPNRTGFENENVDASINDDQAALEKSSTEWPFQRFSWTDHDANTGDEVSYRIIPVIRNSNGGLDLLETNASTWSTNRKLETGTGKYKPFFNRGFVISQFMSRYLAERKLSLAQFKDKVRDKDDKTIREFWSGDLRKAILNELKTALNEGGKIYAALFELSDDELIDALCKLGDRANVVLSNGSVKKEKNETSAQARLKDENETARKRLLQQKVNVEKENRFISPGALGHNKFLVRTNKDDNPTITWTGSTNWTPTGLCTQVNNGLLIEDTEVAGIYLKQWRELRNAQSSFPKPFVALNSEPKLAGEDIAGQVRSTIWFTRTQKGVDLEALQAEVDKAREGILFLMFMPGATGLFSKVAARSAEPNLFVRGVVSELPNGRGDESAVEVNLIDGAKHIPMHLDIIEPEGVKHPFANFAQEVTHK